MIGTVASTSISAVKVDWPGGTQEGLPGGSAGFDQFDGTIRMAVPSHLVQAVNTVDVSFATSGGFISTVILDVDSEMPFNFEIAGEVGPSDVVLGWDSSSAFDYVVQKTTNLVDGAWDTLDTLPGTGASMAFTNAHSDAHGFYKVEVYVE